ncbi:hypothetical protein OSCT_0037 [Oscillochloris trichoides DG-6]|uniref:Uncharacterized protein n=1 Tax=Oscillochloris trichoides DG-6 TaxID=765420 RepID=E1I9N6_9CHLR|nr:hypothetical protein OSCT_0037 [Oscillochloris trichoides DG-6]
MSTAEPPTVPHFRPVGAEVWPVLWSLVGLCVLGIIIATLTGIEELGYALGMVGLTFFFTQIIFWFAGRSNARHGAEFLGSNRPLVRWVYTPEEWQQVRSYFYEQMQRNQPPMGCLPAMFGAIGLLTGFFIGLEEGFPEGLVPMLIALAVGAGFGGLMIIPVKIINHHAAQNIMRASTPATVALGSHELFYERAYFDARVHRLNAIRLRERKRTMARLDIDRFVPRYSLAIYFPTIIFVPPRMLPAVQEVLPKIAVHGRAWEGEDPGDAMDEEE